MPEPTKPADDKAAQDKAAQDKAAQDKAAREQPSAKPAAAAEQSIAEVSAQAQTANVEAGDKETPEGRERPDPASVAGYQPIQPGQSVQSAQLGVLATADRGGKAQVEAGGGRWRIKHSLVGRFPENTIVSSNELAEDVGDMTRLVLLEAIEPLDSTAQGEARTIRNRDSARRRSAGEPEPDAETRDSER